MTSTHGSQLWLSILTNMAKMANTCICQIAKLMEKTQLAVSYVGDFGKYGDFGENGKFSPYVGNFGKYGKMTNSCQITKLTQLLL